MNYKNLETIPGLQRSFSFEIEDDDYVKINLENSSHKFEVFDKNDILVFSKLSSTNDGLGKIKITLSEEESYSLKEGIHRYRLIVITPGQDMKIFWSGFLHVNSPVFDLDSNADNVITLPNGILYPVSEITVQFETWYAIATYSRFLVTGIGVITVDGMDIHGTMWPNLSVYSSNVIDETQWNPSLSSMTAFRVNLVSGSCSVRYLP